MDFMSALDVSASGMKAQRTYMNVISMNLANVKTTRTPEGGAYKRKSVAFAAAPVFNPFDKEMENAENRELKGVVVRGIVTDKRPMKKVHEPGHPDADKDGYVTYPDINVVEEMANMITTMRSYEANVQAIQDTKAMFNKALQIAR
ncbi:MAG TPA: flagellar basal body rod protein FlgC [Humidesulfovibrio sp.]|uniref:flagellar basal body rod protein FlgC n=1 Tax=Humidesulfovibrio sp. TaxID=2910988 RepID=UPI002BFE0B1C|nr:flagellar basal body rod protein FlgC [Humidesulfovibrio sp.]HWR03616.1 flagellar basal body rod protein FlgC [Humidesulfovibrio sp.]